MVYFNEESLKIFRGKTALRHPRPVLTSQLSACLLASLALFPHSLQHPCARDNVCLNQRKKIYLELWSIRRYVGIAAQRLLQPWIEVQLDPVSLPGGLNILIQFPSLPWNVQQLEDIEIDPCRVTLRYERAELLLYFPYRCPILPPEPLSFRFRPCAIWLICILSGSSGQWLGG